MVCRSTALAIPGAGILFAGAAPAVARRRMLLRLILSSSTERS